MKADSPYTTVFVMRRMNTVELLHECVQIAPLTEYGTKPPMYAVLHRALQEYKERHGGNGSAGPTPAKKERRLSL